MGLTHEPSGNRSISTRKALRWLQSWPKSLERPWERPTQLSYFQISDTQLLWDNKYWLVVICWIFRQSAMQQWLPNSGYGTWVRYGVPYGLGILPHQKSKIWEWQNGNLQGRRWKSKEESARKSQRYIDKAVRRQLMVIASNDWNRSEESIITNLPWQKDQQNCHLK